jgi:uncharacterized cupin superfamily protein
MLGAVRIGAGAYEAREGVPIWPYHYHYPDEEWLYVLAGAPVLRDGGGWHVLQTGDIVCFPWHGEGDGPVPPASVTREPEGATGSPIVHARDLTFEPGAGWRWAPLGAAAGGQRLDAAVLEVTSGADFGPYRYEYGRELWLLVLAGVPTVRHAEGERALSPGDLACLTGRASRRPSRAQPWRRDGPRPAAMDDRAPHRHLLPEERRVGAAHPSRSRRDPPSADLARDAPMAQPLSERGTAAWPVVGLIAGVFGRG